MCWLLDLSCGVLVVIWGLCVAATSLVVVLFAGFVVLVVYVILLEWLIRFFAGCLLIVR